MLSAHSVAIAAALLFALSVSVLLVLTKQHHGVLTMDSAVGIQKFHVEPTPRVGGVGIYLGLLLAWGVVQGKEVRDILGIILLAGIPALAFGLLEDITKRVGVLTRLLATMAGGLVACLLSGIALNRLNVHGLDWLLSMTPVAVIVTAFAVGGVANAINIIDGFHGLASGTSIIALLALAAIAARSDDAPLALACILVAAPVVGFWLVNYPWGKLFMGDGGAYFVGFALAWLAVLLPMRNPVVSPWASLLVCAYPIIEVLYSVVRRCVSHRSPGAPDNYHLHSLIKTKVIRPKLSAMGVKNTNVRNAAVSPIVWSFASMPAIVAIAFFDQSLLLVLASMACLFLYHAAHSYLTRMKPVGQSAAPESSPSPGPNCPWVLTCQSACHERDLFLFNGGGNRLSTS